MWSNSRLVARDHQTAGRRLGNSSEDPSACAAAAHRPCAQTDAGDAAIVADTNTTALTKPDKSDVRVASA